MKFITCKSETWKSDRESPDSALLAEVDLSAYDLSELSVVTASLYGNQRASCSLGRCHATDQGLTVSMTFPEADRPKDHQGAARLLTPALAEELSLSVYWIVIGS